MAWADDQDFQLKHWCSLEVWLPSCWAGKRDGESAKVPDKVWKKILTLPSPKCQSAKDYLSQKWAARDSWLHSQLPHFSLPLQGLRITWLKAPQHFGASATYQETRRQQDFMLYRCRTVRCLLVPYHVIPIVTTSQATILSKNEVRQFHIAYSLPTPASFNYCITISNTENTQDNCKCSSVP